MSAITGTVRNGQIVPDEPAACRKVANRYCRVLRPGREMLQQLV